MAKKAPMTTKKENQFGSLQVVIFYQLTTVDKEPKSLAFLWLRTILSQPLLDVSFSSTYYS